jgi:ABC-type transport system substrate-binding protein
MAEPLRVGVTNRVMQIDPHEAIDYTAGMIQLQIFETLFRVDEGKPQPHLIVGAGETSGLRRWELTIDPSHCFSDDTPLTAEIVATSLRRSRRLGDAVTIEADGDRVVVSGVDAQTRADHVLSSPYSAIVLERDGVLLGTGPYRIAGASTPERVQMEANPHHAGPPPTVEEVEFVAYEREDHLVDAATAGRIDFTGALSPQSLREVRRARTQFLTGPSTALVWIHCGRLSDRRVREAISCAIDRDRMTRCSFANPGAFMATSVVPRAFHEYDDGRRFDRARANALLDEAGVNRPLSLRCLLIWGSRMYLPRPLDSAECLREQLAEVGIELSVHQVESPTDYVAQISAGDFDMILGGWTADETSVPVFLDSLFASTNVPSEDGRMPGCNFGRWQDEKTDALLAEIHSEASTASVQALLDHLRHECPVIALHHGCIALALGERVRGREFNALGYPLLASFTLGRPRR